MNLLTRFRRMVDERLQPPYLGLVSGSIVAAACILAGILFATADRGQTALGIPLGADFAGFYVAAQILNQGQSSQLYDRALHHRLYHELLPKEDQRESIPYVHPPFVAGLLRPLAALPYPIAVLIWLVLSASFYLSALVLVLRMLPWQPVSERWLVILIAASFEPFLFECWLGGQLSGIAFLSLALCLTALNSNKPLLAGSMLGICFYKPTTLLLLLPLLLVGRRWRMLVGMTITGVVLVGLSVLLVGWDVNVGYLKVLLSFQQSTSGGDLEIRTWKYVDLSNCLRLLLGDTSPAKRPAFFVLGGIPFVLLSGMWWRYERLNPSQQRQVWATTLTWMPLLNLYFGIYDSIVVVQSALITAYLVRQHSEARTGLRESAFAYLLLTIYVAPWFSQKIALLTGVSIYSVLLAVLGSCQFFSFYRGDRRAWRIEPGTTATLPDVL